MGNNWSGYYTTSLQEAFARGFRSRPDDVSETVKLVLLLGEYMHRNYHNRYHAKAQNLRVLLRAAYDKALSDHDILAMPTIPFPATEIPPPDAPRELYVTSTSAEYLLPRTCSARRRCCRTPPARFASVTALVTSSAVRPYPTSRARIDPDAKRALGGIERRPADARDAANFAQNVSHQEIAEPDLVEAAVGGAQRDDLQHCARGFLDQNALLNDGARQARLDALDAVLHLDRGRLGVGAGNEIGRDVHLAEGIARRIRN